MKGQKNNGKFDRFIITELFQIHIIHILELINELFRSRNYAIHQFRYICMFVIKYKVNDGVGDIQKKKITLFIDSFKLNGDDWNTRDCTLNLE